MNTPQRQKGQPSSSSSSQYPIPYAPCRNDENERVAVELQRHQAKLLKVRTALQHVRLWFMQSASANAAADVHAGVRVPEPELKQARILPPPVSNDDNVSNKTKISTRVLPPPIKRNVLSKPQLFHPPPPPPPSSSSKRARILPPPIVVTSNQETTTKVKLERIPPPPSSSKLARILPPPIVVTSSQETTTKVKLERMPPPPLQK